MAELSYSLHLGNDKNKTAKARQVAKNNPTKSTSFNNNAIQTMAHLTKVDKHNLRKYDENPELIETIIGTNSIVQDIKNLYLDLFEEAKNKYNEKQTRDDRKIDNYFQKISDDNTHDLACEIIIELGDMDFWFDKTDEEKKKMTDVFITQAYDLEEVVPNFKIANATIHYDECSPHLHIVGVPFKHSNKNGMEIQVGKSNVFTKDSLVKIQDEMRDRCIETFNNVYNDNLDLKEKTKGRNRDILTKDMVNYQDIKKEIEDNSISIEDNKSKTSKVIKNINEIEKIFNDIERDGFMKYSISSNEKNKLNDFLKEMKKYMKEYEEMLGMTKRFNILVDENNNLRKQLNKSKNKYDELKNENKDLKSKLNKYEYNNNFLQFKIDNNKYEFVKHINNSVNNKDNEISSSYKKVAKQLHKHKFLNKAEYRLAIGPLFNFSKSEYDSALHKINQEMEEAAEQFYSYKNDESYEL